MFASDRKMIKLEEQEIILAQSFLAYFLSQIKLGKSMEQAILESLKTLIERNLSNGAHYASNSSYLRTLKEIEVEITFAHYGAEDAFTKLSNLFSVYTLRSTFSTMSNLTHFDNTSLINKVELILKMLKIRLSLLKERELTIKTSQFRFIFISIITSLVLGLIVSLSPLLTLSYIKTIFTFNKEVLYLSSVYYPPYLFIFTVGLSYLYVVFNIFRHFFSQQKMILYAALNLFVYLLTVFFASSYLQLILGTIIPS